MRSYLDALKRVQIFHQRSIQSNVDLDPEDQSRAPEFRNACPKPQLGGEFVFLCSVLFSVGVDRWLCESSPLDNCQESIRTTATQNKKF